MRNLTLFGALFVLTFIISNCSSEQQPPENLIAEDTYIDMMVEFQLLETYQNSMPIDSVNTDSLEKVIFEKYTVTEAEFLESKDYYQQDFKAQAKRVDKAIEQLRIDEVQEDSTSTPDTTDKNQPKVVG